MKIARLRTMNSSQVKKQQQKQMKKSSEKKVPVKGLRNVLAQPFDTKWPVLDKDQECRLEELLTKLLPELRRGTPSIPWSQLRKLEKNERRATREKLRLEPKDIKNNGNHIRKTVTLGVNAVTRDLEKEKLDSILLDSGVEPLMIEHVVSMARNKGIPILMAPFLKKVTLEGVGFASAAMGLKCKATDSAHFFHEVHQEIVKFAPMVAPPENMVALPREACHPRIEEVETCEQEEDSSKTSFSLSTSVYEYRSTREERTFVPPNSVEKTSDSREEWGVDFIALGKDEDVKLTVPKYLIPRGMKRFSNERGAPNEKGTRKGNESVSLEEDLPEVKKKRRRKNNATYLPLKVKRIQGNNNRVKATKTKKLKKKMLANKK